MTKLPIHDVIDDIKINLGQRDELVLQAPPGAGKTTVIPLCLMDQAWCKGKILMLEPRRMAARAAAERMAQSLNEKAGQRVGYRIRQDTRVGTSTKIEVVTGGVLTRLLQDDPSLSEYSLIIFDEFHERNLDSDLGLALVVHARKLFRDGSDPLKLIVMSATLDGEKIAQFLDNAPIINSEGRMFPVAIKYTGSTQLLNFLDAVYTTVLSAIKEHEGSILVFLPGQKEITALQRRLEAQIDETILVAPLYGNLPLQKQIQAIESIDRETSQFIRKIVLSTDIAETSLTIDGVTVVIDSGYRREPYFDRKTGLTRLHTTRISQASATQRMGRAGRLSEGICYRVWSKEATLNAFSKAEIEQADLAPLALQVLAFGINLNIDIEKNQELLWITPPPQLAFQQALNLLESLAATEKKYSQFHLTPHGKLIAEFPAHPRLAHMMLIGAQHGLSNEASVLAAALSEPSRPEQLGCDIETWIPIIRSYRGKRNSSHHWFERVNKQADIFTNSITSTRKANACMPSTEIGFLLALAYPDRIAKKRTDDSSIYQLSNGRSAYLHKTASLSQKSWLCAAEIGSSTQSSEDHIYAAAEISPTLFENLLSNEVRTEEYLDWDEQHKRFSSEKRWLIGKMIWKRENNQTPDPALKSSLICELIRRKGLDILNWDDASQQWCARVELVRSQSELLGDKHNWPNVSKQGLTDSLEHWFKSDTDKINTLADLQKIDIYPRLTRLLDWSQTQVLNNLAPSHVNVPTGSVVPIDYTQNPPIIAVKLQEMFGCSKTPRILNNCLSLVIHLLSPARRPLQITQDLEGFWRTSYNDVKKEMKGRYPKHPWPDDPANAIPTRYTKAKMRDQT